MRVRTDLVDRITMRDQVWIPTRDGTRLSARIWLPHDADEQPVPAVLEYIPYRLRDGTVLRDEQMHPYVAAHRYACARVDLRGSGESDGVLTDEYLPLELDDGVDVLAWLADQPWCSGEVGIIGKSWGGFNGLQLAARRPEPLRGVITVCSTDDRYATDVHYMGGNVLASKMLAWASTMFSANALPPDPEVVGERWREMWRERLAGSPPYIETWMAHQRRDEYWEHGSVCVDYSAIECPVLSVGGFADGYTDTVFRLLDGLTCEHKAIVGPWGHQYPHNGRPGPAIGFLQECVRWWDHCLKGRDVGVGDDPALRVWMDDWVDPGKATDHRPGRWVTEPAWPGAIEHIEARLDDSALVLLADLSPARSPEPSPDSSSGHERVPRPATFTISSDTLVGLDGGDWCPAGSPSDLPTDQRRDDGRSVCFDTGPLTDDIAILGPSQLEIVVASDRCCGQIAARICDVAPDGTALLVARGMLNLQHVTGHATPESLTPGDPVVANVPISAAAHRFRAGHRIRLALSATYWPWLWPAPEPFRLTVRAEAARLRLPVRPERDGEEQPVDFGEPEITPMSSSHALAPGGNHRTITHDVDSGEVTVERTSDEATELPRLRIVKGRHRVERCSIVEGDPTSARVTCTSISTMQRDGWRIRIEADTSMTGDRAHFRGTNTLEAYEGDTCIFSTATSWEHPRDHQ